MMQLCSVNPVAHDFLHNEIHPIHLFTSFSWLCTGQGLQAEEIINSCLGDTVWGKGQTRCFTVWLRNYTTEACMWKPLPQDQRPLGII